MFVNKFLNAKNYDGGCFLSFENDFCLFCSFPDA